METLTARPRLLKQANLSLIRKTIKAKGTITRAEIAEETKISSTTVRSLLTEMLQDGEIESIGYDESSGGRKAERYMLKADRYFSVAFCISDGQVHGLLVNICGEILDIRQVEAAEEEYEQAIVSYLDELIPQKEIKSIGIGVPGIVEGGSYWKKYLEDDKFWKVEIGEKLAGKYGIPVVMENNINATAIGFGRRYQKQYPCEDPDFINMAYLHLDKGCVSAGFIAGGRILRGSNNFAGELGLIPMEDGRLLDESIAGPLDDTQYANILVRVICWICGILNPQYVVLSGPDLRKGCIGLIGDDVYSFLPRHMFADILYSDDAWHDYHNGMAYLASGKMFDEVQFLKE